MTHMCRVVFSHVAPYMAQLLLIQSVPVVIFTSLPQSSAAFTYVPLLASLFLTNDAYVLIHHNPGATCAWFYQEGCAGWSEALFLPPWVSLCQEVLDLLACLLN